MKNLKLNKIAEGNLNEKQMHQIKGGGPEDWATCTCGCQYENQGGSSTGNNMSANCVKGLKAPKGVEVKSWCTLS
ncbi:hypothetical protein FACS1894178_3710 [Bacteroidia bacterium]|nr:hypothetical protein FACS1894178_3710 [Bacteroidia bacterium]